MHGARYGPLLLGTHKCPSTEESMGKIHGTKFEDVLVPFFSLPNFMLSISLAGNGSMVIPDREGHCAHLEEDTHQCGIEHLSVKSGSVTIQHDI